MKRPTLLLMLVILASIFLFFLLNLLLGSVHIPFRSVWNILWGNTDESIIWQNIIWKSRVPQALTALVAGAGLSVSGLQMQTVFRNPLAGPSVLGISSGASLGVACVVLLSGAMGGVALSKLGYMGEVALSIAAIIGALSVMALIVYVSQKVKGNVTLLIIGVMIGYVASAIIGVLKYFSVEEDIRAYVIWGLGSFAREEVEYVGKVNMNELYIQLPIMMAARLNLGKNYSASLSAGPYIAYGVGGKTSGEMEEYDYSSEYNPNRSYRFRIDTFGNRIDDKMGNKRFDAGLMFGLNIEYHKFIFGAELQLGMIKVNDQLDNLLQSSGIEKFSPKNLASFFTVGYRF